jgi:hypothetical protein
MSEKVDSGSGCDSCGTTCGPVEVPTKDEKEALDALRKIKARVRELKDEVGGTGDGSSAAREEELKGLRAEWDAWQSRLGEAARERMILLGHEDPD